MAKKILAKAQWDDLDSHPGIDFSKDPGLTKQSHRDETDVNWLVERYGPKVFDNHLGSQALYADVSNVPDYMQALDLVNHAHEQFSNLDAKVRRRFDNDPVKFLAFMGDKQGNFQEMLELGLATVDIWLS